MQQTIRLALDRFGRLDVMMNNAGLAEPAPLEEITLESWNRVIAVTLTSAFLGMKYCLPVMRAQGKGVIVNTASISGTAADYGLSSYNAAKAGVINLTRSAAIENARHNIASTACAQGSSTHAPPRSSGRDRADELRRVYAEPIRSAASARPTRSRAPSSSWPRTRRRSSPVRPSSPTAASTVRTGLPQFHEA